MKLLAFNGSPRTNGTTAKLIKAVCDGVEEQGHEIKVVNLYSIKFSGCRACEACQEKKVNFCVMPDDLTPLLPEIAEADGLIFGSPVYFGQVTGHTKCLIDRFFTFIDRGFNVRLINDKKVVTVVTCGAPGEVFDAVSSEYLKYWFGNFMKMNVVDQIMLGNQTDSDKIPEELFTRAREIGRALFS